MFNFGDEKNVLINKGKKISAGELKSLIAPRVNFLKNSKESKFLITSGDNLEFILNFLSGILAEKEIFLLSDAAKTEDFGRDFIKNIEKGKECDFKFTMPDPSKVFVNFYTSGSTGTSKCVRKTLRNLLLEAEALEKIFPEDKEAVFVSTVKMTHMFGFEFAFLFPFMSGYVIDTDTVKFPEQIKGGKYIFISSPSFLDRMAKYDDNPYPPVCIFSAGDKLNNETFEYFSRQSKVVDIYGSTETGTVGYRTSPKDDLLTTFGDVEIHTGKNNCTVITSSYFNEDELISGDYIEKHGEKFKVLGRADRILKIQEKRISAIELENYLKKHALVEDSYCMKIGEKVAAVVVLTDDGKERILEDGTVEMIKNLKFHIKKFSSIVPQRWRFLSEIPKTEAGKTDKNKITSIFNKNISTPLIFEKKRNGENAEITLAFLRNSNFFRGHFPEIPILPGVVQLLYAHYLAEDVFDIKLNDRKIKKIKFSRVIKPDQKILLKLKNNELSVDFAFTGGDKSFSSGTFIK